MYISLSISYHFISLLLFIYYYLLLSGGVIQVHLSRIYEYQFDQIRMTFRKLILTITPLIKSAIMPRLKEFKTFLQRCFPELKPQLSTAKSFHDVMEIVREKCTMINVVCLKIIVNHYKIEEAEAHIQTYKAEVNQFCEEVKISICENNDFMTSPSTFLKCETIEFILEWKTDEHTLSEIQVILRKAFEDMAKRVLVKCKL